MSLEFLEQYQSFLAFGILVNIIATIGFGIYKSANISQDQALHLITRYSVKPNTVKIIALWLVPFAGFLYVFLEVLKLQTTYLNKGSTVFQYVEDNFKRQSE